MITKIIHFVLDCVQMTNKSMKLFMAILEHRMMDILKQSNASASNVIVNGNKKENHVSLEAVLEIHILKLKVPTKISSRDLLTNFRQHSTLK